MPCISVVIPGLHEVLHTSPRGTVPIEHAIQDATASIAAEVGLSKKDLEVYIIPIWNDVQTTKITIELLARAQRTAEWLQRFAEAVGKAVLSCQKQYPSIKAVVVFTHIQDDHQGFYESSH